VDSFDAVDDSGFSSSSAGHFVAYFVYFVVHATSTSVEYLHPPQNSHPYVVVVLLWIGIGPLSFFVVLEYY
jgi:hypothetical protein